MSARRAAAGLVVVVLAALPALASCDEDGEAVPVRRTRDQASLYVALGGDDVYGGRSGFQTAWPQVLFRTALPITTTFVNLAGRRDGIVDIVRRQLEPARALRPDLVTITVTDDAQRGTDPALVGADLDAVVRRLRRGTKTRVLVGTVPSDVAEPDVVADLNAVINRVASGAGATVVDLAGVQASDQLVRGREIASAFAGALHPDPHSRVAATG